MKYAPQTTQLQPGNKLDKRLTAELARKEWFDDSTRQCSELISQIGKLGKWIYDDTGIKSGWSTSEGGRSSDVSRPTERAAMSAGKDSRHKVVGEQALTEALYQLRRAHTALDAAVEGSG